MPDERSGGLSGLWQRLTRKASEAVADQEVAFVMGKVAGATVTDANGSVIVEAGHRIDDAVVRRALAAGKLHALSSAVLRAQSQDLQEKASEHMGRTPEGREARSLDSVADYAQARRYVGRIAALDVTDIRGNVVVPAGKEINEDDVRAARQAGLLSALIYSAQQSPPPGVRPATPAPSDQPPPVRRSTLPVMKRPGGEDDEA